MYAVSFYEMAPGAMDRVMVLDGLVGSSRILYGNPLEFP
jgi:hypothetical protein